MAPHWLVETARIAVVPLAVIWLLMVAELIGYAVRPKEKRPYDYKRDGECTNSSHPRVLP
jgi:hypothetical protein